MIKNNLETLKIHKLSQKQYDREAAAGRLDENAIYLTPEEKVNPDWEQNDSSAEDYIKNRTHWVEGSEYELLLDTTSYIMIRTGAQIESLRGYSMSKYLGETFIITVDGVKYECTPQQDEKFCTLSRDDMPISIVNGDRQDGLGITWFIYSDNLYTTYEVKIEVGTGIVYHALDENFIPETIARKSDISAITNGDVIVKNAERAESAAEADTAIAATKDGKGNESASTYETKADASDKLAEAKQYTNDQIALIPTPDVSGQINEHNTSETAHDDIRQELAELKEKVAYIEEDDDEDIFDEYTQLNPIDPMGATEEGFPADALKTKEAIEAAIESIPTPDVSGQINTHDTSENSHQDIRNIIENKQDKTLIVRIVDVTARIASHTPSEIMEYFQNGGKVVFFDGGTEHAFLEGDSNTSIFYSSYVGTNKIQATVIELLSDKSFALERYSYAPPVKSVNGKTDAVTLTATDVKADPVGSAASALQEAKEYTDTAIENHDSSAASHNDIRALISDLQSGKSDSGHNHDNKYYSKTAGEELELILDEVKSDVDAFFKDATISDSAKDTLKEIQDYITSDVSAAAEMTASINTKVPTTRKVNGKALSADITLSASDVSAYSKTEVDNKLSGKADSSHGNHVPATQTASNKTFLRNDNTWATVTPANIGAAASSHNHTVSEITDLTATATELNYMDGVTSNVQTQLDGKAASSHGTHVSYSTTAPVMDGTASAGSASTVARSDHKHPVDTSRASKTDFDNHTSDTTKHITSTERTNWNAAKTHADSAHAPSDAQKNQNAFSNVKVGSTTVAADTTTDTLELVAGSNITITPDATNDKITISATDTVYTHPSHTAKSSGFYKVTVDSLGHVSAATAVTKADITGLGIPAQDTTYNNATTSAAGLMSATDKTQHDNLYKRIAGYTVTAGTTSAYTATITGVTLTEGTMIALRFNAANAASATLNVNSLGAKPIYYKGSAVAASACPANAVIELVYDTTQVTTGAWHCVYSYDTNTTYTNVKLGHGYATCSTAEATVAKVGTLSSYTLVTGGIVAVKFTYAVPASATLNINSKGAKAIYYKGAAITANVIKAGDTATFMYNGTYYHLLSIDRWQADIEALQDHANSTHARTDATKVEASSTNGKIKINGTETTVYTHPSGTNPHGTTKSDVGLGNVENKSSATIRGEITKSNVTTALGYTPYTQAEVNNLLANVLIIDSFDSSTGTLNTKSFS